VAKIRPVVVPQTNQTIFCNRRFRNSPFSFDLALW
jgi:hypothetical protein